MDINKLDRELKSAFGKIKEEMEEHLIAINENTDEINANTHMIDDLNLKIQKLNEKLDDIHLVLSELKGGSQKRYSLSQISLTNKEEEVFTTIYTNNGGLMEYKQLARTLGYTEVDVEKIINSLIIKGIPVIKRYADEKVYLMLDSEFRNLQAKEGLVKTRQI